VPALPTPVRGPNRRRALYCREMTVPDPGRPAAGAGSPGGPSVLLVEDEESIAQPFAQALARNGFRPLLARTASEAVRIGREAAPDIILLDLTLPDGDGRDVCRELRRSSDVPIIMLTARGTVTDRVVGLELGADDYIVKPFSTGEVIARIRAVLRRGRTGGGAAQDAPDTPEEIAVRGLRIDLAARRAWLDGTELELTRKELDLLARLARDAGRVVTRETLMSEVWDENWFGSTKTLDVHLAGLRRKLHDDPAAPRWIHTVRGVGFRFAAGDEPAPGNAKRRSAP
jgi:two-component system, OmpR family, response regulator RegX3